MRIGLQSYVLGLLLLLAAGSIGLWSLQRYHTYQQILTREYLQQQQSWQQQIQLAQSNQLLWLQSRFYDLYSGIKLRLDLASHRSYLQDYLGQEKELKQAFLIQANSPQQSEVQSDCITLAQSLFADLEQGSPPLFFSCIHQQQAMTGVKGNFRVYGQAMELVILMDFFSFIPEFSQISGKQLELDTSDPNTGIVFSEATGGEFDLLHEIVFNRDQLVLGSLRLNVQRVGFYKYWLSDAQWMIPLVLLIALMIYFFLYLGLLRPLNSLLERMSSVITAQYPGHNNGNHRLLPGLHLLQRYFIRLTHMAKHDPLTGLYNRVIFEDRVQQALQEARRSARNYALVFIDIEGFHRINRDYGHYIGDGLLRQLAKRLSAGLRESDNLARLEEDNFALLLAYQENDQLVLFLEKIRRALIQPYEIYGRHIRPVVSMGAALYPQHASDMQQLALLADKALTESERLKAGLVMYQPTSNTNSHDGFSRMQSFRQALEKNEFKLVYQPVINLASHHTSYFEALLRWKNQGDDQQSIQQTIDLAENNQFIRPLTRWIIESACRQINQLNNPELKIAVNLSMIDLHDEELPQQIDEMLNRFEIPPRQLMVEITEGQIMQDPEQVIGILNQLSEMGISLSIDDFGTGQASLTYLKKLPVQKLKIDQSFVHDMVTNQDDRSIVEATINLAHTLGIEVVAEGVELMETHDLLVQMGCDFIQGYYITKPIEAEQIPLWCEPAQQAPLENTERTLT